MRLIKFFFLILLYGSAASAAELIVREPATLLVPTMQHLRDHCGAAGHYDACTRFVAYRLQASCAPDGGNSWSIRGSATYAPWIYLFNVESATHELDHIADVRHFIEQHLDAIEALRFDSQSDCAERALIEQSSFESTLRAAVLKSSVARHPLIYRRASRLPQ